MSKCVNGIVKIFLVLATKESYRKFIFCTIFFLVNISYFYMKACSYFQLFIAIYVPLFFFFNPLLQIVVTLNQAAWMVFHSKQADTITNYFEEGKNGRPRHHNPNLQDSCRVHRCKGIWKGFLMVMSKNMECMWRGRFENPFLLWPVNLSTIK